MSVLLLALYLAGAHAACDKPEQQIEVERQQRLAGQVETGVVAFRASVAGEVEKGNAWQAQLASQDIVDQRWKLYLLCQAKEQGIIDAVAHCRLANAVLGQMLGVEAGVEQCSEVAAVKKSGDDGASSGGLVAAGASCRVLREVDAVTVRWPAGFPLTDGAFLWDAGSRSGYFLHRKWKSALVKIEDDARLEVETDYGRALEMSMNQAAYALPTQKIDGWKVKGGLSPNFSNGSGLLVDIEALVGGSVIDANLIPGSSPFLLTAEYENAAKDVKFRSWAVDAMCLPR